MYFELVVKVWLKGATVLLDSVFSKCFVCWAPRGQWQTFVPYVADGPKKGLLRSSLLGLLRKPQQMHSGGATL